MSEDQNLARNISCPCEDSKHTTSSTLSPLWTKEKSFTVEFQLVISTLKQISNKYQLGT